MQRVSRLQYILLRTARLRCSFGFQVVDASIAVWRDRELFRSSMNRLLVLRASSIKIGQKTPSIFDRNADIVVDYGMGIRIITKGDNQNWSLKQ